MDVEKTIRELKEEAKSYGCNIRFSTRKTPCGDFHIFVYDKSLQDTYLVGYDGSFGGKTWNPERCVGLARHWLKVRDKRFVKENGKWRFA